MGRTGGQGHFWPKRVGCSKGWGIGSDQNIGAGYGAEGEVLHGPLLQLHVSIAQLGASTQNTLDGGLGLREEVDELDVGGQQQSAGGHAAQVELGVQQRELHRWAVKEAASADMPVICTPQRRLCSQAGVTGLCAKRVPRNPTLCQLAVAPFPQIDP